MPEIVLPADLAQRVTGTHWSARLQPVTYDLGLRDMRGALLAFADYDSDNFVDLFIASPTAEESLQAWMWRGDVKDGKFELQRQWRVRGLVGLIPGDFDGNGQLDAVAITTHERCADVGALRMHLCDHSMGCATAVDGSVEEARAALEATALPMDGGAMMSQPLTLDLNGDMRPDLLGIRTDPPVYVAAPAQHDGRARAMARSAARASAPMESFPMAMGPCRWWPRQPNVGAGG